MSFFCCTFALAKVLNMKRVRSLAWICLVCMVGTASVMPVSAKPSKVAQREAKKCAQKGWKVFPGSLPFAEQLDASYMAEFTYNEDHTPVYLMASATSNWCPTLAEAEVQAMSMARINIVQALHAEAGVQINGTFSDKEEMYTHTYDEFYRTEYYSNFEKNESRYALYGNGELLVENISRGNGNGASTIHWDAVMRNSEWSEYARTAWCVLKLYRCDKSGFYEVQVKLCNYSPKRQSK